MVWRPEQDLNSFEQLIEIAGYFVKQAVNDK